MTVTNIPYEMVFRRVCKHSLASALDGIVGTSPGHVPFHIILSSSPVFVSPPPVFVSPLPIFVSPLPVLVACDGVL